MRKINSLIVHASATPNDRNVTAKDIDIWHKQRGFKKIGYHFVILRDGTIEEGRNINEIGAHVRGHNRYTIGVCLIGAGYSLDDFTKEQKKSLIKVTNNMITLFPNITIHGHREYSNKSCPGFDIVDFPWNLSTSTKVIIKDTKIIWWRKVLNFLGVNF
jgi:N-acetylmuramoyl-L-alanine amidase